MKWINLIGLTLQFLAFWFAAPELLGESALKRFEAGLKKLVAGLPIIVVMSIVLIYAFSLGGFGIYTGLKGSEEGMDNEAFTKYIMIMVIAFSFYLVVMMFFKRIQTFIKVRVAEPLIDKLIHKSETRKQALIIGAVLFTLGFLMQFVAAALA